MFTIFYCADQGGRKKKAKVVYSYEPENDDELRLEVGEMVDIIKQVCTMYFYLITFMKFNSKEYLIISHV